MNMTSTQKHRTLHLVVAVFLAFLFFTGVASAGTFVIDTSGLSGTVNEKITVPVIVQNAENMCGFQLTVTGDKTAADIVFNKTSVASGFSSDDGTGIIIWTGYSQNPFQKITGTQEMFSIDVTPKKSGLVSLAVNVAAVQAGDSIGSARPVAAYQGSTATLTVSGSSQNPTTPPVNPEIPQNPVNPPVGPNTPTDPPQETPDTPTVTPDDETMDSPETPDEIVPIIPEAPDIPVSPSSSPIPLAGLLIGLAASVMLGRKSI